MFDYNYAPSSRGGAVKTRLEGMIHVGRDVATSALQKLQENQPEDYIVPAKRMVFKELDGHIRMTTKKGDGYGLHDHAIRQVTQRSNIPWKFAEGLMGMQDGEEDRWGARLLGHNLNEIYGRDDKNYLVRTVHEEVRGFLSDRFRRLDSAPVVEAFVKQTMEYGAVPVQARCLDTKFFIKSVLPGVFEPVDGEFVALGITLHNSDYGDGALSMKTFILRLICANGMFGEDLFRKIHLGSRLSVDSLKFSQRTYELDTQTIVSATGDVVKAALEPEKVHAHLGLITAAAKDVIDPRARVEAMRRGSRITKLEAEKISGLFNSAEVERLPTGNTAWRLSNAISLFAQDDAVDPGRSLELENIAGEVAGLSAAA